jgi:hypothetical protein
MTARSGSSVTAAGRSSQPTFTRSITKTPPERTGVSFIALRGVASLSIARGRDDERPACYGYHFSASRLGPSVQGDVNVNESGPMTLTSIPARGDRRTCSWNGCVRSRRSERAPVHHARRHLMQIKAAPFAAR